MSTLKQPGLVRDFIIKVQDDSLKRIRAYLSRLDPFERDAYSLIEENYIEHLTDLTDHTLEILGHNPGNPAEPRFSKTRRAARAIIGKDKDAQSKAG